MSKSSNLEKTGQVVRLAGGFDPADGRRVGSRPEDSQRDLGELLPGRDVDFNHILKATLRLPVSFRLSSR